MPEAALQPNDPVARTPLLRILINGVAASGAIDAEVIANSHYAADRFAVTFAAGADPLFGTAAFASASTLLVDVQMGLAPAGLPAIVGTWRSMVVGQADSVEIDPVQGAVRLEGRDLTAALIEARTQETFANRTASEIATLLAQRHGLIPAVSPTTTPVGRYYQLEHDRITLNQFSRATTEWDLLVFLAEQEGFDVFVRGTTLHFQPPAPAAPPAAILRFRPTPDGPANLIDLRMERHLTLARDIEVTVKSWNARQNKAFTQTARATKGDGGISMQPRRYVFVRPNLTLNEALQYAQHKLAELSRHERVILATMPGELSITPRGTVRLAGSGTAFDQVYYVDEVARRISMQSGFIQTVRAKNETPLGQATPPADLPLATVPLH